MKALVTYLLSFALLPLTARAGIKVPVLNDYANTKLYNNLTRPDTIYPKHAPVAAAAGEHHGRMDSAGDDHLCYWGDRGGAVPGV